MIKRPPTQPLSAADLKKSDARYKRIAAAISKHQRRPDALIEILHKVQDAFGYLPMEAMRYVAQEMNVPPSRVYGVATFYHFFSLKPKGRHNCVICTGTACHVRGAQNLVNAIQSELQLKPGQTTADGELGLQTARCIGCCGLAPAVVLDDHVLANADPKKLVATLREHIGATT
ncbi:MAG: bidirectional hydrogenase complex protein HoxE [Limisphaerales bacterium]|jgi:bidirectional [NiFe] hydrogenase diaphorase subunit